MLLLSSSSKKVLKMSGIDVNTFTAHSTRGASTLAVANSGITTNDILKVADWSTESVFRKFTTRLVLAYS